MDSWHTAQIKRVILLHYEVAAVPLQADIKVPGLPLPVVMDAIRQAFG